MRQLRITGRVAAAIAAVVLFSASHSIAEEGNVERGAKEAQICMSCHKFGEGAKNAFGPVLNGVVGREASSYAGYKYSAALEAANEKGLVWTEDQLVEWLAGPTVFVQKYLGDAEARSKMPIMIEDKQKRQDVVAFLKTLQPTAKKSADTEGRVMLDDAMSAEPDPLAGMKRIRQELVVPPLVPKHTQVAEGGPKIVEIELTVEEKAWIVDNKGTEIRALTFNGSIPAPLMVVHQNDYVELTLKNPSSNLMEHNIDLHAATGALGGAGLTTLSPGEEVVLRFKATKSGVFLYHCAPEGSMTPYHVTHGMTGAIMVLPRDGITDEKGKRLTYDKAFYVGENDFYVPRDENGNYKKYEQSGDDFADWVKEMRTLIPSHIVFNGRVGALTGKNALRANVGETALFLHVQGNRDTRPHLIGGHGDYVWETGSFSSPPLLDQQTWFIRGGSAGAALYTFRQPGIYVYLNHNLIEAVELGAAAHVVVDGKWNNSLMKQLYKGQER